MAGIGDLNKKSPAFFVGIVIGGAVLLAGGYWQFFYSSVQDELATEKRHNSDLQKSNADLKKQKETWEELTLQKDRLDEKSKKNKVSLPASAELPAFFGHMQKQMAASGVSLKSWKREKEVPIESYIKVPVAIRLTGTFYQLNNYFYLLYQTDRIVTVENLSLTKPTFEGSDLVLSAAFTASTFRQADGSLMDGDDDAEETAPAKAAVKAVNEKSAKVVDAPTADAPNAPGTPGTEDKNAADGNAKTGVDRVKNP